MSRLQQSVVRREEQGYILITLLLFVALLAISMVALAPVLSQQIKRDREEELIHRGVQYSRAIKHYFKKFNRYPTRIEDLEDTNNLRFLRKRYKDPVTGKDFKILHLGDVQMSSNPGLAGAMPVANMTGGGIQGPGGGPFGSTGGVGPMAGPGGGFAGSGLSSGPLGNNSAFGNNSSGFGNSGFGNNAGPGGIAGNNQVPIGAQPGDNGSDVGPNNSTGTPQGGFGTAVQNLPGFTSQQSGNPNQVVIGGGPMVGVASTSKEKTIRTFNKKDKYYQWQFIYDPSTDRGGLLNTPSQPALQQQAQGPGGLQGAPGAPGSPQPSGFGAQPLQSGPGGGIQPGGQQPSPFGSQQPQVPQMPPDQGPP